MLKPNLIFWGIFCLSCSFGIANKSSSFPINNLSVAFYNLDNLYDTINDPKTNDDEFTPQGKCNWNTFKYKQKLKKLSKVLSEFDANSCPDILGVCEIENKEVLVDLANTIIPSAYSIVHFDSKDERGVDVALLYKKEKLKLLFSRTYTPVISRDTSDKTRDLLWVKLLNLSTLDTLQFVVCHFPSRKEGQVKSEPNRIDVAKLCKKIIQQNCNLNSQNLIVMGDFNDEPHNKSLAEIIGASNYKLNPNAQIVNLMYTFSELKQGTYRYKDNWNVLDQFLVSSHFITNTNFQVLRNSVFIKNEKWMLQSGKFAGYPYRTYAGNKWLNGYSDHLPIGLRIQFNDKKKN